MKTLNKRMGREVKEENSILTYGNYYDVLDEFEKEVKASNRDAAYGESLSVLQNKFLLLLPKFTFLCGGDLNRKAVPLKKQGRKKKCY